MSKDNYLQGKPGEWYQNEYVAGYYDEQGRFTCVYEFGSAADFDRNAAQIQNGEGYYDAAGNYQSFNIYDD